MKIKYMGTADERVIAKNDDFGGRLPDAAGVELRWNWENHHVIDTDDAKYDDVSDEAWELVLEEPGFKNVTDLKRIPAGLAESTWKGVGASEVNVAPGGVAGNAEPTSSSEADADTTTTTGGSTAGGGGTGGSRTRAGGSTRGGGSR